MLTRDNRNATEVYLSSKVKCMCVFCCCCCFVLQCTDVQAFAEIHPISSTHAQNRKENACETCTVFVANYQFGQHCMSDISQFHESLKWCHRMAKCWHSSACNFEIVPNMLVLMWAGYLSGIEKNGKKMSKMSTMAVVDKVVVRYLKLLSTFNLKIRNSFYFFLKVLLLGAV